MPGIRSYGEIILQFWACWNRNNLWNINTSLYGPAEDFQRSAEGFVEQPAQKTSFWWTCAESRRNVPKLCLKFCSRNLWTKSFALVKVSPENLFGALKTSDFSVGWFLGCSGCFSVWDSCRLNHTKAAKTAQKSSSTKVARFQSSEKVFL